MAALALAAGRRSLRGRAPGAALRSLWEPGRAHCAQLLGVQCGDQGRSLWHHSEQNALQIRPFLGRQRFCLLTKETRIQRASPLAQGFFGLNTPAPGRSLSTQVEHRCHQPRHRWHALGGRHQQDDSGVVVRRYANAAVRHRCRLIWRDCDSRVELTVQGIRRCHFHPNNPATHVGRLGSACKPPGSVQSQQYAVGSACATATRPARSPGLSE